MFVFFCNTLAKRRLNMTCKPQDEYNDIIDYSDDDATLLRNAENRQKLIKRLKDALIEDKISTEQMRVFASVLKDSDSVILKKKALTAKSPNDEDTDLIRILLAKIPNASFVRTLDDGASVSVPRLGNEFEHTSGVPGEKDLGLVHLDIEDLLAGKKK